MQKYLTAFASLVLTQYLVPWSLDNEGVPPCALRLVETFVSECLNFK